MDDHVDVSLMHFFFNLAFWSGKMINFLVPLFH